MSALKKAYKWLTGSANKAAKAQKKKREKTAPKPKGSSRGSAGAKKAQAKSNAKVKEKTKEKVRELTNSVGSQKSGKAKSGGTTGTQAHRSGAVSRNNGINRPQTRSGAISSSTANQRRAGAQKASSNLKSGGMKVTDVFKKDNEKWKQNQIKRQELASKTTATGGRAKTHTQKVGNHAGRAIVKASAEVSTRARVAEGSVKSARTQANKDIKKFENDSGIKLSEEDKRKIRKDYYKETAKILRNDKKLNKEISKSADDFAKKTVKAGTVKAKDLSMSDIVQTQNALRLGQKYGNKALGDELARKVGANMAYNANKNKRAQFVHNLLQGASYGNIENTIGKYSKADRLALKESKESKAGQAGYMAGMMGTFAMSGINGVGQVAGKGAVKGIAKLAGKEAAKTVEKSTAKKWGKQFATNRLGELIAETPINTIDAAKMATDENGKIDKKAFATYMGLNSLMTVGGGSAIDLPGSALTKKRANTFINLQAKKQAGTATKEELERLSKVSQKLSETAKNQYTPSGTIARDTDKQFKAAADQAVYKANANKSKFTKVENRLARKLTDQGMSEKEAQKLIKGNKVQEYVASISKASSKDATPAGIVQSSLSRQEIGNYAYLKEKQRVGAISKEETKQLQPLEAKVAEGKAFADNTLKAVVEESKANIKKATAVDVVRTKHAAEYFESVGMRAEAKEAREVLKTAQDNVRNTIKSVNKAGNKVARLTGREVIVEGSDDIAAAYAKAAGKKAALLDPNEIHGFFDGKSYHINMDSDQAVAYTFGHELTHGFENLGKDYDDFVDALRSYVDEFGDENEWKDELDYTKSIYKDINGADPEKEAISNLVGKYMFEEDGKYLEHLAKKNIPIFSQIYNLVKKLIRGEQSAQDAQLEALSKKMDEMFDKLSARQKSLVESQPEDVRMSFGGEASIERRLTEGNSPRAIQRKEWLNEAKQRLADAEKNFGDDYKEMVRFRKEIFKDTHWYQGYDGKWRYEMDDSHMRFNFGKEIKTGAKDGRLAYYNNKTNRFETASNEEYVKMQEELEGLLGQQSLTKGEKDRAKVLATQTSMYEAFTDGVAPSKLLKHDELFEMFPEMTETFKGESAVKIKFLQDGVYHDYDPAKKFVGGAWNPKTRTLELNAHMFSDKTNYAKELPTYKSDTLKSAEERLSKVSDPNEKEKLRDEIKKLRSRDRNIATLMTTMHELQHIVQRLDGLTRGGSRDAYDSFGPNAIPKNFEKHANEISVLNEKEIDLTEALFNYDSKTATEFFDLYDETITAEGGVSKEAGYDKIFDDLDNMTSDPQKAEDGFVRWIYDSLTDENNPFEDEILRVKSPELEKAIKEYIRNDYKKARIAERDSYVAYDQSAGEVEAREVEKRMYDANGNARTSSDLKNDYPIEDGKEVRFAEVAKRGATQDDLDKVFPNRLTKNSTGTARIANDVPESVSSDVEPNLSIGDRKGKTRTPMPEEIKARESGVEVEAPKAKKAEPKLAKAKQADRAKKSAGDEKTPHRQHPRDVSNPKSTPTEEVSKRLESSKAYKEYQEKPRDEQIKEQSPSLSEMKELMKRDSLSGYETSKHLETIYNAGHFDTKELRNQLEQDLQAGHYSKVKRESHADAVARAEKTVDNDWEKAYKRQINRLDNEDLTAYDYAERKYVLNKLEAMIRAGEGNVDDLVKKHRELSINEVLNVSNTGAALNASKIMKALTPTGRAQLMLRKVEKLNKKFGDRLKEELELTEEQYNRILKAESEEEAAKVLDEVSQELMDQVPGTVFEKLNELRRFTMLFNLRTHERNVIGNSMFWAARSLSDAMEVMAYKLPPVRKRLEKLGGTVEMNHITHRKMINENKKFFEDEFKRVYEGSGSKTQYRDILQTGQPKAFKSKTINKVLDLNYDLLEKEDMFMFKPTFKKAYARWCDSRGITDLSQMTEKQMEQAGKYALQKAEYATFRDDSIFAKKIVGWKTATQGKKGKTQVGTAAYRAANMALEGHLPFVKTPVNILRRSVDYSPVAVFRGVAKIAKSDSPEMFKQAIHDFSSGLTGTGVALLGALLYTQGHITVQAGNVSGDAYYDRDMGYQDYSLVAHNPITGKDYSVSIDWASPMQTSLFMGAAMQQKVEEDGLNFQDTTDIAVKIFNPMLDMSFMQTSKDTFDTFMDRVYRNGTGDNADWTGAITQTVFGRIPQGYLGSLVPQMVSQVATGSDKFQRDTRSTKEGAVAASWESWGRQIANKFPVLRQKINNPKIDRFGNDKENTGGNNIFMRYLNAMVNPSNVKRITLNDTDKKLINIYNKIPENDKNKKFFFYSFTGNPDYELSNGKRMKYSELYKYGKTKRQTQTDLIQSMFDAKSYKHMTNEMKVDEIDAYHFTSQTQADWKTYGAKYALERIVGSKAIGGKTVNVPDESRSGGKTDAQAWRIFKDLNSGDKSSAERFVDFWVKKENLIARSHNTDYHVKALACAMTNNPELGRAYNINTDKMKLASDYIKNKGKNKAIAQFTDACSNIASQLEKAQVESTSKANRSWAAAGHKDIDEATYRAMGFDWNSAQSGAGLRNHYGHSADELIKMASDAKYEYDADQNGYLNKQEVIAYIDSLGWKSKQHKACLFEYIAGGSSNNPYDSINDYLKWGENTDEDGYGGYGYGYGRRGRGGGWGRGGGGRGGSGSGGAMPKTASGAIKGKVTDPFSTSNGSSKSNLNDAYRKKYAKLVKEARKKH